MHEHRQAAKLAPLIDYNSNITLITIITFFIVYESNVCSFESKECRM